MFGAEMSSAWPICFWLTWRFAATSIRMLNSTTLRSSGFMWRANTLRISIAARLAP